ncbi:hypothetical protein LTR53_006519 [Teratosphaeriaceae sp. CCFEE 6253]|nr:hypothetical protein LTR53_006519 [Teratosphaeriaceae sp. CCFEE 6253]
MASSEGPQGERLQAGGPHPTMAGNMFDPNVKADGKMGSGQGVGGTSERNVKQEGAEHLRQTTGSSTGYTSGGASEGVGGLSSQQGGDEYSRDMTGGGSGYGGGSSQGVGGMSGQESADYPRDTTSVSSAFGSGIGSGSSQGVGGMSGQAVEQGGAAYSHDRAGHSTRFGDGVRSGSSQSDDQIHQEGIDHIKDHIGQPHGSTGASSETTQSGGGGYLAGMKNMLGLGGKPAHEEGTSTSTSGLGDSSYGARDASYGERDASYGERDASYGDRSAMSGGAGDGGLTDTTNADAMKAPAMNPTTPRDSDVTTDAGPTESATDSSLTNAERADASDHDASGLAQKENKLSAKETGSSRENRDAIPTAGGEKLGQRHWGESKIVPDVPPRQEAERPGVSSADGQPTDQVRSNTAANTGGAAAPASHGGGASSEAHKEGLVDKMKTKMHMGGK